jgi:hypothetical protein
MVLDLRRQAGFELVRFILKLAEGVVKTPGDWNMVGTK